ncbi:MAG: hypothetical protein JWR00_1884 [Rubritepida sp.]|nr:hypothetical protein [Rubritepida sp.]
MRSAPLSPFLLAAPAPVVAQPAAEKPEPLAPIQPRPAHEPANRN